MILPLPACRTREQATTPARQRPKHARFIVTQNNYAPQHREFFDSLSTRYGCFGPKGS